jgi:flavin-dependent dehydrogenase
VLSMTLKPKGWAVRRDVLDPWLAALAQDAGAEIAFGQTAQEAHLWATGKEHDGLKSRYFAVKGYCSDRGDALKSRDIVLYQLQGGYIGFTKMKGGELSYCALLDRTKTASQWKYANWAQLCSGLFETNKPLLHWACAEDSLLEHHVGAARFDFTGRDPVRNGKWFAGDAVQLVPPFVGDGMAMALEGGELAARALSEGWSDVQYAHAWGKKFKARLKVANTLHPLLWWEGIHEPAVALLKRAPRVSQWLYQSTRGLSRV